MMLPVALRSHEKKRLAWLSPLTVVILLLILLASYVYLSSGIVIIILNILTLITLASAWSMFSANTGYWNLGHSVFWGSGIYVAGLAGSVIAYLFPGTTSDSLALSQTIVPSIMVGAGLAACIGIATYRLDRRGFAIFSFVLALVAYEGSQYIGSGYVLRPVRTAEIYVYALILAAFSMLLSIWVLRSQWGAMLRLIADDEMLAKSHGVNVLAVKIGMFSVSGALIAASGCITAYRIGYVAHDIAFPFEIIPITLAAAVLGGYKHLWGPFIGAIVVGLAGIVIVDRSHLAVIAAITLYLCVKFLPNGILGGLTRMNSGFLPNKSLRKSDSQPESAASTALDSGATYSDANLSPDPDTAIFHVRGLNYAVDSLQVLTNINLQISPGETVGLFGSGKTMLIDCVSGFRYPQTAEVFLNGQDITHLPAWRVNRYGLVRTFASTPLYSSLTVFQNMLVARSWRNLSAWDWFIGFPDSVIDEAVSFLRLLGIYEFADKPIGCLSSSQRRLLSLGMTLMSQPHIIFLDDFLAGMDYDFCHDLIRILKRLKLERNLSFVITSSDRQCMLKVCDRILSLRAGIIVDESDMPLPDKRP